jgi:hypothetical protein
VASSGLPDTANAFVVTSIFGVHAIECTMWRLLEIVSWETHAGEQTREQPRLNLPIYNYENAWETAETIDLWVADRKSVG